MILLFCDFDFLDLEEFALVESWTQLTQSSTSIRGFLASFCMSFCNLVLKIICAHFLKFAHTFSSLHSLYQICLYNTRICLYLLEYSEVANLLIKSFWKDDAVKQTSESPLLLPCELQIFSTNIFPCELHRKFILKYFLLWTANMFSCDCTSNICSKRRNNLAVNFWAWRMVSTISYHLLTNRFLIRLSNLLTKGRCFLMTERVSDSLRQGNMCSFSVSPSIANLNLISEN